MQLTLLRLATGAFAAMICIGAASAQKPVEVDWREAYDHRIGPAPELATEWRGIDTRLPESFLDGGWTFQVEVDEAGRVIRADTDPDRDPIGESAPHFLEAKRTVETVRFRPFLRNGKPVRAQLWIEVKDRPQSYRGPADRAFPASPDLSSLRIRLERTGCYGECPDYAVEIHGDGEVVYSGRYHVLLAGEHRWRIPIPSVMALTYLFREADYFNLDGYYVADATDLPTFYTSLRIGAQEKYVIDYGFSPGQAIASMSRGDNGEPPMPAIVRMIEDAIDHYSGSKTWVYGDEHTFEALRAEGFDFKSNTAAALMGELASRCNLELARAFLAAGAPTNERSASILTGSDQKARVALAECGDAAHLRERIGAKGLSKPDADELLQIGAAGGFPDIVRIALQYTKEVNRQPYVDKGRTLLHHAVEAYQPDADSPKAGKFDSAEVVRLLLAAGVDANAVDQYGQTPLEATYSESVARALLAGGAHLPADPLRRASFMDMVEREGWTALARDIKNKAPPQSPR